MSITRARVEAGELAPAELVEAETGKGTEKGSGGHGSSAPECGAGQAAAGNRGEVPGDGVKAERKIERVPEETGGEQELVAGPVGGIEADAADEGTAGGGGASESGEGAGEIGASDRRVSAGSEEAAAAGVREVKPEGAPGAEFAEEARGIEPETKQEVKRLLEEALEPRDREARQKAEQAQEPAWALALVEELESRLRHVEMRMRMNRSS